MAAIKARELLASAAFDAMKLASKLACLGVEAALRALALASERVPAGIPLPVAVVDRANCRARA